MINLDRLAQARIAGISVAHLSSVALAIVLALLVWLVASDEERPMVDHSFPDVASDAPRIEFRNVPPGRSVYDPSARVARIRLRGIQGAMDELVAEDFEVWADLSGVSPTASAVAIPLTAHCVSSCSRRGFRIESVVPRTVDVKLSPTLTRTLQIELMPQDDLPPGLRIGAHVITPTNATLVGASVPAASVRTVGAQLSGLSEVRQEHRFNNVHLVALDWSDRVVEDVSLSPETVDVALRAQRAQAVAVVFPRLTNEEGVAAGYFLSAVTVEPEVVELDGPPDEVEELGRKGQINTEEVDLSGAAEPFVRTVQLDLPENVIALNATDGVSVTVELEALPGTRQLDVLVEARGLAEGLVAEITPAQVQLLLSGDEPDLRQLQQQLQQMEDATGTAPGVAPGANDAASADSRGEQDRPVQAYVVLTNLGPGEHRVAVRVEAPAGLAVASVTPSEVEVTIVRTDRARSRALRSPSPVR